MGCPPAVSSCPVHLFQRRIAAGPKTASEGARRRAWTGRARPLRKLAQTRSTLRLWSEGVCVVDPSDPQDLTQTL